MDDGDTWLTAPVPTRAAVDYSRWQSRRECPASITNDSAPLLKYKHTHTHTGSGRGGAARRELRNM